MPKHGSLPVLILVSLVAATILASSACEKKNPPAEKPQEIVVVDQPAPKPAATSQNILHKTFALSTSAIFPFEVPPHTAMPNLHGNYKSFVKQLGVESNPDNANVDFLILNEEQYGDFLHGRAGEAIFSADASHDQNVNFGLPPSQDQPRKYYLVFRNIPGGEAKKLVQADFTVDF